jgi:NAD(P)-dependent dehydrogenase (short-subunit alcohol dehydrogenase family)
VTDLFDLTGRVAVITGGAGMLGMRHAEIVAAYGGIPVSLDLADAKAEASYVCDVTRAESVNAALQKIMTRFGRVDILVNNAANNPRVENSRELDFSRFENFPLDQWQADIAAGLTGAMLCSQAFGACMAQAFREHGRRGVILNIASDLAVIAPDQRIYRQTGIADHLQPVKAVSYPVVKSGLVALGRYLATYWAESGIRVNSLSPGGIYDGQSDSFVEKVTNLIPMGRMANWNEYQGAVLFLVSDASSYMTGQNLVIDGGRTVW